MILISLSLDDAKNSLQLLFFKQQGNSTQLLDHLLQCFLCSMLEQENWKISIRSLRERLFQTVKVFLNITHSYPTNWNWNHHVD